MMATALFAQPKPWRFLNWLLGVWAIFWVLLFLTRMHGELSVDGKWLWGELVCYGVPGSAATTLVAALTKRSARFDECLEQPLHWLRRMWKWLPLQLLVFLIVHFTAYTLLCGAVVNESWIARFLLEGAIFTLLYAMACALYYGARLYKAWAAERLRAKQQANVARMAQLVQQTQQLRPHFLFNALNTLSSLIYTDPEKADLLLTRLTALFRAATDKGLEHRLVDELDLLRAYADIVAARFEDRIRICWEVAPDLQSLRVPTFGLQPLLENCVRHVVERRNKPTHIVIRAQRDADRLRMEIEDDGDLTTVPVARGVGLGNIERRLELLYGTQASLRLSLRPGGGLRACVEVPCKP